MTNNIVDELIEQNNLLIEFNKTQSANSESMNDDGSMHKFVSVQFNESVACEFCNKKIWFKNAYQCIYCNYKIHMKCIDRAAGKTICARFFAKNKDSIEEPFEVINPSDTNTNLDTKTPTISLNDDLISVNSATSSTANTTRNLVSNFFSGIRQRRLNNNSETQTGFNLLSSFRYRQTNTSNASNNNNNNNLLNDDLANSDVDEFKDFDSNEEKLFGTELFEELPLDERKVKFDEQINKYQTTIDMMKRMKSEYEKELEMLLKSKKNRMAKTFLNTSVFNQKEERLRSEIKHTDEQMKCVMFLLMQCQIGLSNCTDLQASANINSIQIENNTNNNNSPPQTHTLDLILNENTSDDKPLQVNYETSEFVQ